MTDSLSSVFSRDRLSNMADLATYMRGLSYAADGRVERLAHGDRRMTATVRGSTPYAVALWIEDGEPSWSCSCPVGETGALCKHCIAVAMAREPAVLEQLLDPKEDEPDPEVATDMEALSLYVHSLEVERLAALVLEQAASDWRLRQRLLAESATVRGSMIDMAVWRCRLDAAFLTGDFVPYQEAAGWARDVDDIIGALADLLELGHAAAVVVLAEYAFGLAEEAVGCIDDSDGYLTDLSSRVADLHLCACEMARPDPVALAGRLVELELNAELDGFHRAAASYAQVLGTEGLEAYRQLVEPRFEALQCSGERQYGDYAVRNAMVGVALASGDPDQLVAVKARDLRLPDDYAEIATALADADRLPEAVEWAQRGLVAFPDRPWQTHRLREVLAELHRRSGDLVSAVNVFWQGLEIAPSLDTYRRLLQEATVAGTIEQSKARALEYLRSRPGSALIDILLYEGEVAEAWHVASSNGCDQRTWLKLARVRENTHPEDAIPIYAREVLALIEPTKSKLYRHAVDYIARIQRLYTAAGRPEDFAAYVAEIRAEHKRKHSLMGLLRAKGW